MSSNGWKEITLNDIAYLNYGKSLIADNRKKGSIPVYSSSGITGQHDKALVNEEGIIIGRKGNVGSVFYSNQPFYCIDTAYYIKKSEIICDIKYLYYLLKTLRLDRLNEDSAVPGLNRDTAHSQTFFYPESIETQRRIADILSALDDKIELNRQTNATLEAIAQAIFKEWFVKFNFPGATGELVESELGMIPKGWRVGKLGEVCEFAYGKGLKAEKRVKGIYPVVGSGGIVGFHDKYLVKGPGIVIGRKGTIGEVTWVHQDFFPIDTTFYINDLIGSKLLFFHYFLLKEQDFNKIGSDSAVPGLNRNMAYGISVIIPPLSLINDFNSLIRCIFEDILNCEQQSSVLSKIRDSLLPKLMNGEIEV